MDTPTQLFLDGRWSNAHNGASFDVVDPGDGRLLGAVADAGAEDAQAMVEAADRAQKDWGRTTAEERGEFLHAAADLLTGRMGQISEVMTREQGKPLAQSVAEYEYGIRFLHWFAEEARRVNGSVVPSSSRAKRIVVTRQPIGITVAVTPWNFPSLQIIRKVGAAFAAGCTVIIKPSELTPLSALEIARAFSDAGLPAGVLQVATCADPVPVVETFMRDTRVRGISFTGSTEVGKILMRGAADTMKRVSLELGGQAPFIVFPDADLELVVREFMNNKLRNMGQTCVAANRLYAHESIVEQLGERLTREFAQLHVGHGMEPDIDVGPLIDGNAVEKVERHVDDAVSKGASVMIGGERLGIGSHAGSFYAPTVLRDANESMLLAQEETFGPVAPIFSFADEGEVIARANGTPYGLAAYYFTRDLARGIRVAEQLEFGTIGLNDGSISAVQAPFGGVKQSGHGREGGSEGLDDYLETKYLSIGGLDETHVGNR